MVKTKTKAVRKSAAGELVFWLHTLILILITVSGLFIGFWWALVLLVLVRLQQVVFHGCILTLIEVKQRGLKKGTSCFYLTFKRFFGIRLSRRGVYIVSLVQNALTLLIAAYAEINHIGIHL